MAAANYVRHGACVADIGCDHGLLCVHLAAYHSCKKVIACDVNEKPLQQAAQNFALHAAGKAVECRLGNGLSVLQPHEVDDIVIAGMSGVTTAQILNASPAFWQPDKRFILVPVTKHIELRSFLCENGFSILSETPVEAATRFYSVMHVRYTGAMQPPTLRFCTIGLAANGTAAAAGYLQKELRNLQGRLAGAQGEEKRQLQAVIAEIEQEVQRCQSN